LTDEDWYFNSISEMMGFKVSPYDLKYTWSYIDVVKMREYLVIKQIKEEAYQRDAKLKEGNP
jgi:hypothetical protein